MGKVLEFKTYRKTATTEMRPYVEGEDMTGISVSPEITPEIGDLIARDPSNHSDLWLITAGFFAANYGEVEDG